MIILYVNYMPPCFSEFFPFVEYCRNQKLDVNFIVYFNYRIWASQTHHIEMCLKNGIKVVGYNGEALHGSVVLDKPSIKMDIEKNYKKNGLIKKIIRWFCIERLCTYLLDVFWNDLYNPFWDLSFLYNRFVVIEKIIKRYSPDIIIHGLDMAHLDSSLIIQYAKKKGIPNIVLTWIYATGDDPANVYYNNNIYPNHSLKRWLNIIVAKRYPQYLYKYRGVEIIRLPAAQLLVREILKLGEPLPWVFNSGYADAIVVDSNAMYNYYHRAGIPKEQLRITGMPMQDVLFKSVTNKSIIRSQIYNYYEFDIKKPLILTAFIPDCFGLLKGTSYPKEFYSYDELNSFWMDNLARLNDRYNLLATVHPGTSDQERDELDNKYGIRVMRSLHSTALVLPISVLHITSVSSTIRWAIACNVPVIDYDVYDFDNQLGDVPGVVKIYAKKDFIEIVEIILSNEQFIGKLKEIQKESVSEYGLIDGLSSERLLDLISAMINDERLGVHSE